MLLTVFSFQARGQDVISIDSILTLYDEGIVTPDSLNTIYQTRSLTDKEKIELLRVISFYPSSPDCIKNSQTLIELSRKTNDIDGLITGYINLGNALEQEGDFTGSISNALEAIRVGDSAEYPKRANSYNNLGYLYTKTKDYSQAKKYLRRALVLQNKIDSTDYRYLLSMHYNLGDVFLKNNELDSGYYHLQRSKKLASLLNTDQYDPYFEGNLGTYLMKKGDLEEGKVHLLNAAEQMVEYDDPIAAMEFYNLLTDLAQKQGDDELALLYANRALELGSDINAYTDLIDTYYNFYELSEASGDSDKALEYYKTHIELKNKAINLTTVQQMNNLRNEAELTKKEKEVALQELRADRNRTISIISAVLVFLLSLLIIGLFNRFKYIRKTSRIIEQEKERSDALLRNILPDETADELKAHGKVSAKQFDSVSVMFADFCGFTRYSQNMDPDALVKRVDFYFSKFDEIMEKYDLEKIKTMGDAYMCAGGLPFPSEDHARRMVLAAFEMADFVEEFKAEAPDDPTRFDCRIGITTGPVVAGVVGTKKFVYDIWGDTVNIASRMESNSEAGKINVSENTYQIIKDEFDCDFRGMVEVKNKGMMRMYFVNREAKVRSRESGVVSRKGYG
ncbi:adenylate/guanylate cyclase domain-containing protein [Robertkochia marina]|nr:adenylate/guanylate cyclase domain-containing protein [Robertkochia marina]